MFTFWSGFDERDALSNLKVKVIGVTIETQRVTSAKTLPFLTTRVLIREESGGSGSLRGDQKVITVLTLLTLLDCQESHN